MAYYASLASLVQLLEDIVHRNRYKNLLLHKKQIVSVYKKFSCLQTLLDDYSPKHREEADVLERRIRDAAYQAQDIIETHISDRVHLKEEIHGAKWALGHLISDLQKAIFGHENQGLSKVKKQVNSIVEELLGMKKNKTTEDLKLNHYPTDPGTSKRAHNHADTMEGVEERLMMIKEQLCGVPSKLQVVSIVGMGGIGKTTLSRNIFDDQLIVDRFDCRAWVTVSQIYNVDKVLHDILKSLTGSSEVEQLGDKIYKHLKGRRYLIIMDDTWETKVWDDIKRALPNDSNGSRVMITTRLSDVASYAGSSDFSHYMQILTNDQSWNLFRKKVFCPPELEDIGKLIAKNCGGLPLAIVVVAGLLSKVNKKRSYWVEIASNVSSAAVKDDEQFSKILSLSYYHLPHHLKPLFLYMGSFPDDNEFHISNLVLFWIAEGFLKPIESKNFEEVAEQYLDDLVQRNLVSITKKTFSGKIKCCGIHDILKDLCRNIVCYDNFFHVLDEASSIYPNAARDVRRIYIHRDQHTLENAKKGGPHVRLIFRDKGYIYQIFTVVLHLYPPISLSFIMEFRLLRILRAVDQSLRHFPSEILELFHLRYLALWASVLPIPPSISKLRNLQTLILDGKTFQSLALEENSQLPSQIWEMPNLRHIMVPGLKLESLSRERIVGEPHILENLHTLLEVVNVSFTNELIGMIPNLKKLKVQYHERSNPWQRFHLNNLINLRQLESLGIYFSGWHNSTVQAFPESFAFPSNLNQLSLEGCGIPWKDLTVVGSLPNLHVLKLKHNAFVVEKWESVEGKFPQLRFLLMEYLGLKYWEAENTHFPRLQRLKISRCWNLEAIPFEIGEISTLELVEVYGTNLTALSALKMQNEQRDYGNDVLQVRIYELSNLQERQIYFPW